MMWTYRIMENSYWQSHWPEALSVFEIIPPNKPKDFKSYYWTKTVERAREVCAERNRS